MLSRQGVVGYSIGGLGYRESLKDRALILQSLVSRLDGALPRVLPLGVGSMVEVLEAISAGVDVVELKYPFEMANRGFALVFDVRMPPVVDLPGRETSILGETYPSPVEVETTKEWFLNLNEARYAEEFVPIEEGGNPGGDPRPEDGTSTEGGETHAGGEAHHRGVLLREAYTRGYLHHLLGLKELVAFIALSRHNLRKYWDFFAEIRAHIERGTLSVYTEWFYATHALRVSDLGSCSDLPFLDLCKGPKEAGEPKPKRARTEE